MFVSEAEIKVRYAETDQMGVVYHANYLVWMEVGRTKLIEDLGFRYADMEKDGILSPVIDIQISYKKPARYGETVTVKTWVDAYDGLRVKYGYEVYTETGDLAVKREFNACLRKKRQFPPGCVPPPLPKMA